VNRIIWLVGLVVIVLFIAGYLGLRWARVAFAGAQPSVRRRSAAEPLVAMAASTHRQPARRDALPGSASGRTTLL